ncbi:MAG TPA: MtnX-like HAD-IB family phosphatase [Candidatus Kapabacteria bacterium]|nr:MtnX-like HAD-IB family phosphatase [Candidatus Kapabacteria bacterium]
MNANANYEKNIKNTCIFLDLDGTITQNDLTDVIFKKYGDFDGTLAKLINKEISIFDYWREFAKALPEDFLEIGLNEIIESEQIDPYFISFIEFCQNNNLPVAIITDNFDLIIDKYLKAKLPENIYKDKIQTNIYCNRLLKTENGFMAQFPYASENCQCLSAVCKMNVILTSTPDDSIVIYAGDGFSDFCAARVSDIIFAKKTLAKYCSEKRIPHYTYKSFFDIEKILSKLLNQSILRQRYQAHLNRKEAYEIE